MSLLRLSRYVFAQHLEPISRCNSQLHASTSCSRGWSSQPNNRNANLPSVPTKQQQAAPEEEWTEVIDQKTGQAYWWNQQTGETTELGELKPRSRFHNSGHAEEGGPFQAEWREPSEPDRTYTYAGIGIASGVLLGWATQFMH